MKHRLFASAALLACLAMVPAQAQIFGPSDDEVAAQKAHEDGQDARIRQNAQDQEQATTQLREQTQGQLRDLNDRVRSLTDSLARATGSNEELAHQISQLNTRIDQQQKDFNYRLCTISAQQLGADAGSLNCAAAGAGSGPAGPSQFAPGAALPPLGGSQNNNFGGVPNNTSGSIRGNNFGGDNSNRGRPPGVMGTLPGSGPSNPGPASAESGSGQFDGAMNLMARGQFPEAAAGFRAYADSHPDDTNLAPQALYWVGTIAYTQQDYPGAARTFAEQIKKYPKAPRSADSLLKMGQALVAQGQTSSGCTAFAAVRKQYPDASPSTLAAAAAARKTANCK
jgi:tol-pal system protein YbgF